MCRSKGQLQTTYFAVYLGGLLDISGLLQLGSYIHWFRHHLYQGVWKCMSTKSNIIELTTISCWDLRTWWQCYNKLGRRMIRRNENMKKSERETKEKKNGWASWWNPKTTAWGAFLWLSGKVPRDGLYSLLLGILKPVAKFRLSMRQSSLASH